MWSIFQDIGSGTIVDVNMDIGININNIIIINTNIYNCCYLYVPTFILVCFGIAWIVMLGAISIGKPVCIDIKTSMYININSTICIDTKINESLYNTAIDAGIEISKIIINDMYSNRL